MAARRKNLLEAFQSPPRPSGTGPGPVSPPGDEPPFAPRMRSLPSMPRWLIAVVALGLAFALGFVAGRGSRGEAEASEAPAQKPSKPLVAPTRQDPRARTETPASSAPAAPNAAAETRIEDSALFDTKNEHTVVVAAYGPDAKDFAWATYEHLREAGLAVFPPVLSGKSLIVLCGAAPTSSELEATEKAVRALMRDGKHPYSDAYRARIDKLISRTKPGESR